MTIYIDIHEPDSIITQLKHYGVDIEVKSLPIGDYWIGKAIIERKTIDDYLRSIIGNRYYDQIYNIMKNTDRGMVYIIGTYPRHIPVIRTGRTVTPIDIERMLRATKILSYYSFKIPVFHVATEKEFILDLLEFHNKSGKTKPSLKPLSIKRKSRTIEEIRTDIYGCIPGIGKTVANYLGKHYSIEQVLLMSKEELSNLKIGKRKLGKRGENIYNVLRS